MKKRLLSSIGALVTGASLACGQAPLGSFSISQPPLVRQQSVRIYVPSSTVKPDELRIETSAAPTPASEARPTERAAAPIAPGTTAVSTYAPASSATPLLPDLGVLAEPAGASIAAPCCVPVCDPCPPQRWTRTWASSEYLLWWVKQGPLGVPLVTMNPDSANTIAALNEPGTRVLLGAGGNNSMNYGNFSGIRTTLGGWLDPEGTFGLEGSGFLLEQRSVAFGANTSGPNDVLLGIPFFANQPFNGIPVGESTLNGGGSPTNVQFQTTSRLWGAEGNGLVNLLQTRQFLWAMLVGFRYLDLQEGLNLSTSFVDDVTGSGGVFTVTDRFATRNQFYGGQIGTRMGWNLGPLSLLATAKVALGSTHESLYVNGNTAVSNNAFGLPSGIYPGGLFAQPTNSGQFKNNEFSVVPEIQGQIGYNLTENVRAFVGYTFLYATNWLRPGNQIDRYVNPSQVPSGFLIAGTNGALVGPPAPLPQMNHSDFWVHGISWGLQLSF